MSDATDYAEAQFADMWFDAQEPDGGVAAGDLGVALWTTAPANDPDPDNEVSGDSYSRVTGTNWDLDLEAAPREYSNADEIDFGVLDTSDSTTVEGVVLVREDLADDEFIYANDDVSATVDAGNEFKINAGDATFNID